MNWHSWILGLVFGVVFTLLAVNFYTLYENSEYMDYKCFAFDNEQNLSRVSLSGIKVSWDSGSIQKYRTSVEMFQIGKKALRQPMLVFGWNRTRADRAIDNITVLGFMEVQCPDKVDALREKIRDTTQYGPGNVNETVKTEY